MVHYPINNYDVSLNIGNYVHFSDRLGDLPLDFYVLPEDKAQGGKAIYPGKRNAGDLWALFRRLSLS